MAGKIGETVLEMIFRERNAAVQSGTCLICKKPARERCYSEAGLREFELSGMCEPCFDRTFEDEGDAE